jgi:hypothetical protein
VKSSFNLHGGPGPVPAPKCPVLGSLAQLRRPGPGQAPHRPALLLPVYLAAGHTVRKLSEICLRGGAWAGKHRPAARPPGTRQSGPQPHSWSWPPHSPPVARPTLHAAANVLHTVLTLAAVIVGVGATAVECAWRWRRRRPDAARVRPSVPLWRGPPGRSPRPPGDRTHPAGAPALPRRVG